MLLFAKISYAKDALVAVAANFAEVAELLKDDFENRTEHRLTMTFGSTGKFYNQITYGAPFDVFLAADQIRPERLEREGFAVKGSRFTYAAGRLSLWSPRSKDTVLDGKKILKENKFRFVAIANPKVAPYGAAAQDVMTSLDVLDNIKGRIVMGENIGQVYSMVFTENAEVGFVALSYMLSPRHKPRGGRWDIPKNLHRPIRQDAVLIMRAKHNKAAVAFLNYLKSNGAHNIMKRYGYLVN